MPTDRQYKHSMAENLPHHINRTPNTGGRVKKNESRIFKDKDRYFVLYGEVRYAGLRVRRKYFSTFGEAREWRQTNQEIVL
jgi:hypothetical protein